MSKLVSSGRQWLPASVLALRDYSASTFSSDLIAGLTVGLVALPLAMAFAISSGMTPQAGIYCAVVIGFTNGIALIIASTQLKDFLGVPLPQPIPSEFVPRMARLAENIGLFSAESTLLATACLLLILAWGRAFPRVPGYIMALVVGTLVAAVGGLHVDTVGSRFGGIMETPLSPSRAAG